jgi:hypothetical protein
VGLIYNPMLYNKKLQVLFVLVLACKSSFSYMMVHSNDIDMQERYFFVTKLNGQNMLVNHSEMDEEDVKSMFTPDIPIDHQWIVPWDSTKPLDDYKVGDDMTIMWFAKLPDNYRYDIYSLYLLKKNIQNPLIIDPTKFSFRKKFVIPIEDSAVLHNMKVLLKAAFPDSEKLRRTHAGLNDKTDTFQQYYDHINNEDRLETHYRGSEDQKLKRFRADVAAAFNNLNKEIDRVGMTMFKVIEQNGAPNAKYVESLDNLIPYFYGNVDQRVYFYTRTFNVNIDEVESNDVDRGQQVLDRGFWFEFSLEFPPGLEKTYLEENTDSDIEKWMEILDDSDYYSRRILI